MVPVDTSLRLDELGELDLYRVTGKGDNIKFPTIKIYTETDLGGSWFVDTPKAGAYKYLMLLIDVQMLPNTRFIAVLDIKPTHEYFDKLNAINLSLYTGDLAEAQKGYSELTTGLTVKYSRTPIAWPPFENYRKFFVDSLRSLYDQIAVEEPAIGADMKKLRDTLKSAGIRISDLFECNCQKDFVANELFSDSTKFLIPLQNLLNVPEALSYFATGRLDIQEFEPYKVVKAVDLQKRIDNLGRLKTALTNISYFYHLSSFADRIRPSVKDGIYNSVLDALPAIDKRIKELTDFNKKIRKGINSMKGIDSEEPVAGGILPSGEDLQTASGHYIIPDLGLAVAATSVNHKPGATVRPYLGVNISFIAIDKSQPLRAIEHRRLWHHLSFVMGLTTTSLSRQGTSDLIKSMSVVGGFAYRLSRAFRVTGGVLVYNRDNPNPDLPQQVAVGPLLALSLDLDLAKWFGDLKSKLF
jgi:hypothetical protein